MSILGYSAAYFLPQYWANTPLYGEKIIPLLDYILSTDYANTEQLASAFYDIESKYKNTSDLPIDKIEAIIEESGYGYVRNLLGQDDESLKLLVYVLVLLHQLKGTKRGLEAVLQLLKSSRDKMDLGVIGNPKIDPNQDVSQISTSDYVFYSNFKVGSDPFVIDFKFRTSNNFDNAQCIASALDYGFYIGINTFGQVVLKLGQKTDGSRGWQSINGVSTFTSDRILQKNTNYYLRLEYTGNEYEVKVSLDGSKYYFYLAISSSTPLGITGGNIYLGIDRSTSVTQHPFQGTISLAPFSVISSDMKITQWFETFPVERENTFTVDAEVDIGLVSTDFFLNFAHFAERYVYPTLAAFRAKLALKGVVTFVPYVREKVTYVATNMYDDNQTYMVVDEDNTEDHIPYQVDDGGGSSEDFVVRPS